MHGSVPDIEPLLVLFADKTCVVVWYAHETEDRCSDSFLSFFALPTFFALHPRVLHPRKNHLSGLLFPSSSSSSSARKFAKTLEGEGEEKFSPSSFPPPLHLFFFPFFRPLCFPSSFPSSEFANQVLKSVRQESSTFPFVNRIPLYFSQAVCNVFRCVQDGVCLRER